MSAATIERTEMRKSMFSLKDVQIRDSSDQGGFRITGVAAVFGMPSLDLGGFREIIQRGAFARALAAEPDVVLLVNHKSSMVLARTRNGTLSIREEPNGLHIVADAAPTTYAQNLRISMQRGDVDQMSFAFTVPKDGYTLERDSSGQQIRTVSRVDELFDVSVVTQPAFEQTSAVMHARQGAHSDAVRARRGALLAKAETGLRKAQDARLAP